MAGRDFVGRWSEPIDCLGMVALLNLIGLAAVALGSLVHFSDAARSLADGVFSATSVIGYSINKSIFLYGVYLGTAAVGALIVRARIAQSRVQAGMSEIKTGYRLSMGRAEWLGLACFILIVIGLNIASRETLFNGNTLYSEQFYNAAAAIEWRAWPHTELAYPYAQANLLFLSLSSHVGVTLIAYVFAINAVALLVLYIAVALCVKNIWWRLAAFGSIVIFYAQPILEPTLHRNVGRFFIPIFVVVYFITIAEHTFRRPVFRFASLIFFHAALLLFGSADTIAIGYVLYAIMLGVLWFEKRFAWEYLWTPIVGVLALTLIGGIDFWFFVLGQLRSISLYSGHANATPFLNVFAPPVWSIKYLLKYASSAIIFYMPVFLAFQLILWIIFEYRRERLMLASSYVLTLLLGLAFMLYFRQNFGDAGVGRIGIASAPLFFLCPLLWTLQPNGLLRRINRGITVFLVVSGVVSVYYLCFSIIDVTTMRSIAASAEAHGYVACPNTPVGRRLVAAGFVYCDPSLTAEIEELERRVGSSSIAVFDDTFTLYYLLGKRPISLIPTYYSADARQAELIDLMNRRGVDYMIQPRLGHFFGVPETAIDNPRFMQHIRSVIMNTMRPVAELPHFRLHERR